MIKENKIFLEHILENIKDIELFTKGVSQEGFNNNKEKQNAVVRSLEIIGEAAKNLSENLKKKYPRVPWKEIAGTRDRIIHHYFGIDLQIIWNIVKIDLPDLKKKILIIIKEMKN